MHRSLLLLFLFYSFHSSTLQAKEKDFVHFDFSIYLWPYETESPKSNDDPDLIVYHKKGNSYVEHGLYAGQKNQWKKYSGPPPFVLYTKSKDPETGMEIYRPYANVQFNLIAEKLIIFLFSENVHSNGLRHTFALNVDDDFIKKGEARVINIGTETVMIKTGMSNKAFELKKLQNVAFPISEAKNNQLPLQLFRQKKGRWKRGFTKTITVNPESKILYIFSPSTLQKGSWRFFPFNID